MVTHVIEAAQALSPTRLIAVIGHQGEQVREALADAGPSFVVQREQLGTGHAVLQAAPQIRDSGASTHMYRTEPVSKTFKKIRNLRGFVLGICI